MHGAEIDFTDGEGHTALDWAIQKRQVEAGAYS